MSTPSEIQDWPGKLTYNPRTYTPSETEDEGGIYSTLAESALDTGDWSWKPKRNAKFPQFGMPAYKPARHPLEGIRFNQRKET